MASKTREDDRLARYLLGDLSDGERARLEAEYFEDDDAFERMLIAEEELTDAYVRGELPPAERVRFEESYLSSQRGCERVQFARHLSRAVSDARRVETAQETQGAPGRSPFAAARARGAAWRFAFAAAALVAAVCFVWLLVERARTGEELRQLRAERLTLVERAQEMERRANAEQGRSAELRAQLEAGPARPTPEAPPPGAEVVSQQRTPTQANRLPRERVKKNDAVAARHTPGRGGRPGVPNMTEVAGLAGGVSFDLTPGLVRGGGGPNTLAVPAEATFVLLRLYLEAGASLESYRAAIETADGRTVWRADAVKPSRPIRPGGVLELPAAPARSLPPGDYVLTLSGRLPDGSLEGVGDYSFRVIRK